MWPWEIWPVYLWQTCKTWEWSQTSYCHITKAKHPSTQASSVHHDVVSQIRCPLWIKGTDLLIADTLSRAHQDNSGNDQGDCTRIMNVSVFGDIPDQRLNEICEATSCDASLQSARKLVLEGWPADKCKTPVCALPFFWCTWLSKCRGWNSGERRSSCDSSGSESINQEKTTQCCDSMLHKARGKVYWPNMASDIKQIADMCETCKEMKPWNPPEPLKQHSDSDEPWQKIGLDFFEITRNHHLAVTDCYSNFIKINSLTTMTSACTVTSLKEHCACYGIPRMIVLHGDPQFTSQELKLFVQNWGITHMTSSPMH